MAKKEPLFVGQKVWLETTNRFGTDVRYEQEPEEMIVLEANKTTAYIWYQNEGRVRYKVNQKTHETKYPMPNGRGYRLWLSKEEYDNNVVYEKEMSELREKAKNKIQVMSLEELRLFVSSK